MAEPGSDIAVLMETHRNVVDTVLVQAQEFARSENGLHQAALSLPLDEFVVLKFVMSAKKRSDDVSKASRMALEKIKEALRFRKDYQDVLREARQSRNIEFTIPGHVGGWLGSELIVVLMFGQADMGKILSDFGGPEPVFRISVKASESLRVILDEKSRETGRLHKLLTVMMMDGLQEKKLASLGMLKVMGRISKMNDTCTPQLQSRTVLVRPPPTFRTLFNLAKPFFSKSTIEKVTMCGSKDINDDVSQCPFLKKLAARPQEVIPGVLKGGEYPIGITVPPIENGPST